MSISEELKAPKVAIYIRVSTHWQIDKDSLQVQRRELIAYAQMVLGIKDHVVFEDPGYSAKNTDRPDYQKMMDRLRTGEFTHLLVWKIDRISRNLLDFANMYEELKRLGVTFVSKNEQFDTSSAIGEAMLKIILIFAELERNMTAERVSAVMLSRANNGQWNGGKIPYGYNYNKETKSFSPNVTEATIVKRMFKLYEREQSLLAVCRQLNEDGCRSRAGKEWSPASVRKILVNVFYIGQYRYNATSQGGSEYKARAASEWIICEDHHEPIIDKLLFDRIQFLLKRNRRGGIEEGETYVRKNIHIFSGLIKCGNCGANMSATLDRIRANGWRPSIYGCSRRRNNISDCQNKYISDVTIGPFVFNFAANMMRLQNHISKSTSIDTIKSKLLKGVPFQDVVSINDDFITSLRASILSGVTGLEFKPSYVMDCNLKSQEGRDELVARKNKHELALKRLHSLYLYGDKSIPEKDFIIEQQRITSQIEAINKQLELMPDPGVLDLNNTELADKASYFIMADKLLHDREINYEKYIRSLEPTIPKAFIKSIIRSITVTDGRIVSIQFTSGLTAEFSYK